MNTAERKQAEHYDRIADTYVAHYFDEWAQKYRSEFFDGPLLDGIPLEGKSVLEAMCGSGQITTELLSRGAQVTGLDVSPEMIKRFDATYGGRCASVCSSITETGLESEQFDVVVVIGGLHHVHPNVEDALQEIHRLLRPGGHFCFVEPHAGSLPDFVRRVWYRVDKYFEENESSIDIDELETSQASNFSFVRRQHAGSLAYPFVCTSMVWRIPLSWKKYYSAPLIRAERAFAPFSNKKMSFFVVCQWQKK